MRGGRRGIQKDGGEAVVIPCNIGRKQEVEALVKGTLDKWGRIDTLVCNAAVNPYFGPLAGIADDAFDKIMSPNIKSNLWLANLAIPGMAERGGGSVTIVSSIGGIRGSAHARRLRHLQGRRLLAGPQPGRGVGAEERPRQLHRARAS